MKRPNLVMVGIIAAGVIALIVLLIPGAPQRNITSDDFNSAAGEGLATGGAPRPPERP